MYNVPLAFLCYRETFSRSDTVFYYIKPPLDKSKLRAANSLEKASSHFNRTENSIRPTISSDGVYGSGQYLASYDTARLSPSIR